MLEVTRKMGEKKEGARDALQRVVKGKQGKTNVYNEI